MMEARDLFDDNGAGIQNHTIIGATLTDDRLVLQLDGGYPDGRYALEIKCGYDSRIDPQLEPVLLIGYDEPAGAGADPYGRPDPKTHPEAWTE
jgi:hypothetical protein